MHSHYAVSHAYSLVDSEDEDKSEPEVLISPIKAPTTAALRPVWPPSKRVLNRV